jgi:restriction system protein
MNENDIRSLTPGLPVYPQARHFLRILDGVPYTRYRSMYNTIREQRGNPQEIVSWTDPESWIPERLQGEEQALALRIWRESKRELNPRYLRGSWYLNSKHDLMVRDNQDILCVTERGRQFLQQPDSAIVAEIDSYEGNLTILRLVAERGPGKRSEFLPDFIAFCQLQTNYRSENPIKGALYDRLTNLIDRSLVSRSGQTYEVTDEGLAYLELYATLVPGQITQAGKQSDLRKVAKEMRQEAREQLADFLSTMNPFK